MSRIIRIAQVLSDDSSERERLLNDWVKAISYDTRYQIASDYIEKLRKQFKETPMPELLQWIEESKKGLAWEKQRWEIGRVQREKEEERQKLNLRTARDEYERTDGVFERTVCSNQNPLFEKKGMLAYDNDIVDQDKELQGYYGVHVGDSDWIPILIRDGLCDEDYAYIYDIDTAPVYNSKKPFYVIDDFHITDKTNTPDSNIIFSRFHVIPAKLITLKEVIPVSEIEPAPDLY